MGNAPSTRLVLIPVAAGLLGAVFLMGVYVGLVSLAESPEHAVDLFWQDRVFVVPIIIGFGVQVGLYARLRLGPRVRARMAGATTAAGGGMSTAAMVACCAHHVADVLPVLGLSAAATLLAQWKVPFLVVGLLMNLAGITVMLRALRRELRHGAARPDTAEATA